MGNTGAGVSPTKRSKTNLSTIFTASTGNSFGPFASISSCSCQFQQRLNVDHAAIFHPLVLEVTMFSVSVVACVVQ